MHRCRTRLSTWLALLAVLAMAVLPTLSHALAWSRGGNAAWAEACTPQGMRLVAVDTAADATPGAPMQAAGHLEHCPLCALGSDLPLLPPAPQAALPVVVLPALVPARFLQAPHTPHPWRAAQPRGPPSVS